MKTLTIIAAAFLPAVSFAQQELDGDNGIFSLIQSFIDIAVPIVFALAVLFFLFKLAMFLFGTGDVKEEAKGGMVLGIIVLLVMFSIVGIINLLQSTFSIDNGNSINVPSIDLNSDSVQFNN